MKVRDFFHENLLLTIKKVSPKDIGCSLVPSSVICAIKFNVLKGLVACWTMSLLPLLLLLLMQSLLEIQL